MLYSKKGNFIFVANPKTGTTAFQKSVKTIDDSARINTFPNKYRDIKIPGHATAQRIKELIGNDYESSKKICFVRNPYEKVVSAYFFLINGKPLVHGSVFNYNKNINVFLKALKTQLTILLAKTLPFEIWSMLYTYKKNLDYVLDERGKFLINYICRTEVIDEDLKFVFDSIDYEKKDLFNLNKINKSKHDAAEKYFSKKWHKKLFDRKYKNEIKFYNSLKNNYHTDLIGKDVSFLYID